ncbi:MAG: hypothetical protein R6V53_06735 [Candidatus Woesearchaeota archaeon]
MSHPKADTIFEVSWEVCNKVGGIYTVVASKIRPTQEFYSNYYLIGPYFQEKSHGEFEELPPEGRLRKAFDTLKAEGIQCRFGQWLVAGKPKTILIDFHEFMSHSDDIKAKLWESDKIDSLNAGNDFTEPLTWAYAVGRFLEEYHESGEKIVAQFHEWLAGAGLLYIKNKNIPIGTVFTTHATMLGRTLSSAGINIYSQLDTLDSDTEANKHGIHNKHQVEKACAKKAGCFTTVSEITATEAEAFHKRKPDVLLLNGLDSSKFPTMEECSLKHNLYRTKLREFIMSYFFPYQTFDIDQTLIYFICGRNEFHVKGIDIMIESLGRLNEQMKQEENPKTVVAFFFIPGNIKGIKREVVENKTYFMDVKDHLQDNEELIHQNILKKYLTQSEPPLLPEETENEIYKTIHKLKKEGVPPLSTHDLHDEENDTVIASFRKAGLNNKEDDKVKVVFYPIFLTGADGLLNTDYYETMLGGHLGIFPSYYEPWGYTPLECASLAVPAITSDLAGFGQYIGKHFQDKQNKGIFVINRQEGSDPVTELTGIMNTYATLPRHDRMENKINAKKLSSLADWKVLIENYIKAHNRALDRL